MTGKMNSTVIGGMSYELLYLVFCAVLQVCQMRTIGSLALPAKWSSLPFTKTLDTLGLIWLSHLSEKSNSWELGYVFLLLGKLCRGNCYSKLHPEKHSVTLATVPTQLPIIVFI